MVVENTIIDYKKIFRKDGYIYGICVGHPRAQRGKYVLEHILVMEGYLGRYLNKGEIVHHKNHIRQDNRLENLQLMSDSEHRRNHNMERRKDMSNRMCHICNSNTTKARKAEPPKRMIPYVHWYHSPLDKSKWCCYKCHKSLMRERKTVKHSEGSQVHQIKLSSFQ